MSVLDGIIIGFILCMVALHFLGFIIVGKRPQQPSGCRCAHTCPKCKAWLEHVKQNKVPCPGKNEDDFYFDAWNNEWILKPLPKVVQELDVKHLVQKARETLIDCQQKLDEMAVPKL